MNLYIRYFDNEALAYSVEEALDFLYSIPEIGMNPELEADIRDYVASDVYYPKRYKVRQRVYFIMIKTTAATMNDFKQKKALHPMPMPSNVNERREMLLQRIIAEIAQLVEHDLAKVGVAGSSPVFRSFY